MYPVLGPSPEYLRCLQSRAIHFYLEGQGQHPPANGRPGPVTGGHRIGQKRGGGA